MIINQKQNLLYKDRMSHKSKHGVTKAQLSSNKHEKTLLEDSSRNISFKGVFSLYNAKNYNLAKNIKLLEKNIGRAPRVLTENINKPHWQDIRKHIVDLGNGEVEVSTKNWTRLLLEGIVYPIAELPLHIANSLKKAITGKGFGTTAEKTTTMANRSWLQKKIDILDNSEIINSIDGYMDQASKLKYDNAETQSRSLFTKAMKMFDPKSGSYNGVHERALTRIVTGFIPAFFLANDAYNLSRICDDNKDLATKEQKIRFNQETKRVVSNAYLQLITLGALSKYINSSKLVFMAVTAATVIATETLSRLSNGKKVHFINKEQAIELNKKEAEKNKTQNNVSTKENKAPENFEKAQKPSFKSSKVFDVFGLANLMPIFNLENGDTTNDKTKQIEEELKKLRTDKPLLNLSTLAKWFGGMIVAGFAMKYAKKNVNIKEIKLEKYLNVLSEKYTKFYDKITKKKYTISKEEYSKIISKLKEYDEVIGRKFEEVILKYQKSEKLSQEASNIAKELKAAGLDDLAIQFEHLNNKSKTNSFSLLQARVNAEKFFKNRDNAVIEKNINELFEILRNNNLENEVTSIKNILFKDGVFNPDNYAKAKKYIEKTASLKEYLTTFENRFKVDADTENLKMFEQAIQRLRAVNAQKAEELEKLINDAAQNAAEYSLGKRNTPIVREFFDFITQPFKFAWGAITLPFKHVANPLYNLAKQEVSLPKAEKEIDFVFNAIKKLKYKSKLSFNGKAKIDLPTEQFAQHMDKQINKAFNSATLSSVSNSDLSVIAKTTSTVATSWFLLADNHNMVMQKSNGEDKEGAVLKAKERAVQETSRTFYNTMFINLFNETFRSVYNSSLLGAQAINTASTLIGEYVNRTMIGMPVKASSREEILNKEYENLTDKGLKGKFFRFMSRLTGKKVLSQRTNNTEKKQK